MVYLCNCGHLKSNHFDNPAIQHCLAEKCPCLSYSPVFTSLHISQITTQERDRIIEILVKYINETGATCGESVMQVDKCNLAAAEYMADMVGVIEEEIDMNEEEIYMDDEE